MTDETTEGWRQLTLYDSGGKVRAADADRPQAVRLDRRSRQAREHGEWLNSN